MTSDISPADTASPPPPPAPLPLLFWALPLHTHRNHRLPAPRFASAELLRLHAPRRFEVGPLGRDREPHGRNARAARGHARQRRQQRRRPQQEHPGHGGERPGRGARGRGGWIEGSIAELGLLRAAGGGVRAGIHVEQDDRSVPRGLRGGRTGARGVCGLSGELLYVM